MTNDGTGPLTRDEFAQAFGQRLATHALIDPLSLERARRAAVKSGERFDQVLTKLGLISESDLATHVAAFFRIPLVSPEMVPARPILRDSVDVRFVRQSGVLPLAVSKGVLTLAVTDPLSDEPVRALGYMTGLVTEIGLIAPAQFERAVQALYFEHIDAEAPEHSDTRFGGATESDVQKLKELANEAPIIKLVNQIVVDAVESKASDIHIEPGVEALLVRYRIDGALRTSQALALGVRPAVTSRIKIMAKLDIAERRLPQDGRVRIAVRGVDVDFRVSTIPTIHGESIVLRILDRRHVELDFQTLGFTTETIRSLRRLANEPNGIVLVTGPTGSGKTTTLYTVLKELNSPSVKIFTVEDPIEYQLSGVNQVQVQPAIGLDFPSVLRAILRQNPNIIMIGEIRDIETARIAVQASLTGHLVLSTLHTNGAAASIARLVDMGIESYLIASTLKGVLAQRLVRRICRNCGTSALGHNSSIHGADPVSPRTRDIEPRSDDVLCAECAGSGLAGRTTVSELLVVDDVIHNLILQTASEKSIEAAARAAGMRTLYENGVEKVDRGETTMSEVLGVTRVDTP